MCGELWQQLKLDDFWRERLGVSREGTDWLEVLKTLSAGNGMFTLLGFLGMYTVLGILFLFLVRREIEQGPVAQAGSAH